MGWPRGQFHKITQVQLDAAVRKYEAGDSIATCAERMGISRQSLWASFKRRGVRMRPQKQTGRRNHFWRHGEGKTRHPAHRAVQRAFRDGGMAKPNACERCGQETPARLLSGHHDDYDKPLDVVWLCGACHYRHHAEE